MERAPNASPERGGGTKCRRGTAAHWVALRHKIARDARVCVPYEITPYKRRCDKTVIKFTQYTCNCLHFVLNYPSL